jgi:hypothetical protein
MRYGVAGGDRRGARLPDPGVRIASEDPMHRGARRCGKAAVHQLPYDLLHRAASGYDVIEHDGRAAIEFLDSPTSSADSSPDTTLNVASVSRPPQRTHTRVAQSNPSACTTEESRRK